VIAHTIASAQAGLPDAAGDGFDRSSELWQTSGAFTFWGEGQMNIQRALLAAAVLATGPGATAAPRPDAPAAQREKQAPADCSPGDQGKRKLIPGACQDPRSGSPDAPAKAVADCEASVKKYDMKLPAGACQVESTQVNIRMFTARRELCERERLISQGTVVVRRCLTNDH
jgi:hypothetical protein